MCRHAKRARDVGAAVELPGERKAAGKSARAVKPKLALNRCLVNWPQREAGTRVRAMNSRLSLRRLPRLGRFRFRNMWNQSAGKAFPSLRPSMMDRRLSQHPDNVRASLEQRLCDAERRSKRASLLVEWQEKLIAEMAGQGHSDISLALEVLHSLRESRDWNDAQVEQIKSDIRFLNGQERTRSS